MRYAVLDLGSNSIKCVMAETSARGVRVLHEESIGTRLAEHLIDTCELRPEAMERTLAALKTIRAKADKLCIEKFRAVATSAVRDSRNRREFLRAAKAVLGFPVRLLSGNEEAETIFAGVTADSHWHGQGHFHSRYRRRQRGVGAGSPGQNGKADQPAARRGATARAISA